MAKYVFVVYAVSEDDGLERLRLFGQFKTEKDAWEGNGEQAQPSVR